MVSLLIIFSVYVSYFWAHPSLVPKGGPLSI